MMGPVRPFNISVRTSDNDREQSEKEEGYREPPKIEIPLNFHVNETMIYMPDRPIRLLFGSESPIPTDHIMSQLTFAKKRKLPVREMSFLGSQFLDGASKVFGLLAKKWNSRRLTSSDQPLKQSRWSRSLKELTISNLIPHMNNHDLMSLAPFLNGNTSIRRLDLSRSNFSGRVLECLCGSNGFLTRNDKLQVLVLGGNQTFGDEGAKIVVLALQDGEEDNKKKEKIRRLKVLSMDSCAISPKGASSISSLVVNCSSLRVLELSHNQLGDAGAIHISESISNEECRLEHLGLNGNGIGDPGAEKLADALTSNRSLHTLTLQSNKEITDSSASLLLEAVFNTQSLENVIESNHSLRNLDLKGCDSVRQDLLALGNDLSSECGIQRSREEVIRWKVSRYLENDLGSAVALDFADFELVPNLLAFMSGTGSGFNNLFQTLRSWNVPLLQESEEASEEQSGEPELVHESWDVDVLHTDEESATEESIPAAHLAEEAIASSRIDIDGREEMSVRHEGEDVFVVGDAIADSQDSSVPIDSTPTVAVLHRSDNMNREDHDADMRDSIDVVSGEFDASHIGESAIAEATNANSGDLAEDRTDIRTTRTSEDRNEELRDPTNTMVENSIISAIRSRTSDISIAENNYADPHVLSAPYTTEATNPEDHYADLRRSLRSDIYSGLRVLSSTGTPFIADLPVQFAIETTDARDDNNNYRNTNSQEAINPAANVFAHVDERRENTEHTDAYSQDSVSRPEESFNASYADDASNVIAPNADSRDTVDPIYRGSDASIDDIFVARDANRSGSWLHPHETPNAEYASAASQDNIGLPFDESLNVSNWYSTKHFDTAMQDLMRGFLGCSGKTACSTDGGISSPSINFKVEFASVGITAAAA